MTHHSCSIGAFAGLLAVAAVAAPALADNPCIAAAKAAYSAKSYETVMNLTAHGHPMSATVDIVRPGSVEMHSPMMDMIGIGDKAWMRRGSGKWRSFPMAIGGLSSIEPDDVIKRYGSATSCIDGGTVTWAGQPAHLYKYSATAKGRTSTGDMYVFPDGYIHHMTWASGNDSGRIDMSKFNAVRITPPV